MVFMWIQNHHHHLLFVFHSITHHILLIINIIIIIIIIIIVIITIVIIGELSSLSLQLDYQRKENQNPASHTTAGSLPELEGH